ncbi:hypothetical protein LQZ19_02140 [Treponema primitia]|uniref:hypothetical protein n=1 Tax=Treponema primitia TaxID=88058 RepID=UPI00397FA603
MEESTMKFERNVLVVFLLIALSAPALMAESFNAMSLSGATGLYTVPTGRIGWTNDTKIGLDIGYHTIIATEHNYFNSSNLLNTDDDDVGLNHIAKIGAGFFKWAELFLAFDFQPSYNLPGDDNDSNTDLITGFKIQLPAAATDVALGGNFQALNLGNKEFSYQTFQLYAAVTYEGTFFTLPAETTVALGKTFNFNNDHDVSQKDFNFDFGMGFDLTIFPKAIPEFFHWIIDYSNFSYSANPWGADSEYRGTLNTGLRLNFGSIPALKKAKFTFDFLLTDAFDADYRSFSLGLAVGVPLM